MSSRTNLKLQLQREQAQRDQRDTQEDRRGNGFSISSSTGSLTGSDGGGGTASTPSQFSYPPHNQLSQQQRGSPLPRNPNNTPTSVSISATLPTPTDFQQQYSMSVQTRLENPTRFYVEEKQKQQMKTYFSNSLGRGSPLLGHSLPSQLTMNNLRQQSLNNIQSPLTPDSPMTPHSIGTPHSPAITDVSEMDELIEDIMELESKGPKSRSTRSPKDQMGRSYRDTTSPVPTNAAGNQDYLRMLDPVTGKLVSPVSSSCPATLHGVKSESSLTEEDGKYFSKDRQKKDNHNIIERKRRDNINNLIKELRTMLPHSSDPSKGSTLKATVDYLKELKKDRERLRVLDERQKSVEHQNRKLQMKIQELERLVEAHGIQLPMTNHDSGSLAQMAPHLSNLLTTGKGSPQPDSYPGTPTLQQQHQYHSQQYMQIKQEPSQSPIHQHFPQYMNMNLPDDFPGVNFSVADLANMMDTAELDPMVSSLTNPFENFNVGDGQQLGDMDFLT